jgi:hypothetical protein
MRNFRKTRKRGGFEFSRVFECPILKSGKKAAASTCAKKFTDMNDLLIVKTLDDGNCFYDTLSKYGKRTGLNSLNVSHLELRKAVVESLLNNINDIAPYFVSNTGNEMTIYNIEDEIKELGKPNRWNSNGGDIVIQYASQVFNITINIYDVKDEEPYDVINRLVFTPVGVSRAEVNMLRTNDSHYQLLWPRTGPMAAVLPRGKKSVTSKKKTLKNNKNKNYNSNNSLTRNLKKIALLESTKY